MSGNDFNFSSTYMDNFPKILGALNISIAVTSYQSASLILLGSDGEGITTNFKKFPRPMGIYADEERFTLGTFNEVIDFRRSDALLEKIKNGTLDSTAKFSRKVLEKDPEAMEALQKRREEELQDLKQSDSLYVQQASLTTGMINIHDIAWGQEGLWVVNSTFSCLSTLSPTHSFVARWKPEFISELVPEDRCHLNGMAVRDGKPRYVTTFNMEDKLDSWYKGRVDYGTLIDIDTHEYLMEGLIMPHSPKYHDGHIYVCESGYGLVWKVNPETKEKMEFLRLPGFTRGLFIYGDLMLVGTSQIRSSDVKNKIPLTDMYKETVAGVWLVSLDSGELISHLHFNGDVKQIYDLCIIPSSNMPDFIKQGSSLTRHLFDFTSSEL